MSRAFQWRRGDWADSCPLIIALCLCYSWLMQTILDTIEWLQTKPSFNTAVSGFCRNATCNSAETMSPIQIRSFVQGKKKEICSCVLIRILTLRSLEYGGGIRAVPLIREILLYCINGWSDQGGAWLGTRETMNQSFELNTAVTIGVSLSVGHRDGCPTWSFRGFVGFAGQIRADMLVYY
jgi:hypothetical protein